MIKLDREGYRYLLSYMYTYKTGDKLQYEGNGTGRIVITLDFMIKTDSDILLVEERLRKEVDVDNLTNLSLMSFSELSGKD